MAEKLSAAVAALEQELGYWREQAEAAWGQVRVYEIRAKSRGHVEIAREVGKWHVAFAMDENELVGMDMADPRLFLYGLLEAFSASPRPLHIEIAHVTEDATVESA
jgi:hypothetical protein